MRFKIPLKKLCLILILLLVLVLLFVRIFTEEVITDDVSNQFTAERINLDEVNQDGFDFQSVKQKFSIGAQALKNNWRFLVHDETEQTEIVSTQYLQQQIAEIKANYDEEIKLKQNNVAGSLEEYRKNRQIQAKVLFEEKSVNLQEQLNEEIQRRKAQDKAELEQYRREIYNNYRLKIAATQVKSVLEEIPKLFAKDSEKKSGNELEQLNEIINQKVAQRQKEQETAFAVFSQQKQAECAQKLHAYNAELQDEVSAEVADFKADGDGDLQRWQLQRKRERDRAIKSRNTKEIIP